VQAGGRVHGARWRTTNEQMRGEGRALASQTAATPIANRLKTGRIPTRAVRRPRCTQWHGLCL